MFLIHLCLTGTRTELRRELCHVHAPSSRLGCEHSPGSPPQGISAQLRSQSCCCTIHHMLAWGWSMCGKPHGSEWGPELCFPRTFSRSFYFRHTVDTDASSHCVRRSHCRSHWPFPSLGRSAAHQVSDLENTSSSLCPFVAVSPLWLSRGTGFSTTASRLLKFCSDWFSYGRLTSKHFF